MNLPLNVEDLNTASPDTARPELIRCCGSARWADAILARRPYSSKDALFAASDEIWQGLDRSDWLEAFSHHPKIGDVNSLREKFASTSTWAEGEQKGVQSADEKTLSGLAQGNLDYEQKFGYIFIVCATGKSAGEMLALLEARLPNSEGDEILVAMQEQNKITRIRLEKLLS